MIRVVDASVLIKAYVPETGSEAAARFFAAMDGGEVEALAPDLIYSESGNILWKKVRRGELTAGEAREISAAILGLPLRVEPGHVLLPLALDLALSCGVTVYDALYLALACVHETTFVTADRKLVLALEATDFRRHVQDLE
ncbi:MAG: type II toxin-antitoxin system VapC family toxin [Deltaproteobacteria bacterium]|nr:type II toxin-antitoxin system VapC family toxin [Deltaproteobacteria bacterium]